jgi:hypothetical protein
MIEKEDRLSLGFVTFCHAFEIRGPGNICRVRVPDNVTPSRIRKTGLCRPRKSEGESTGTEGADQGEAIACHGSFQLVACGARRYSARCERKTDELPSTIAPVIPVITRHLPAARICGQRRRPSSPASPADQARISPISARPATFATPALRGGS